MTTMRHLIVFLPGIMGSALQKNGRDAWALSGGALWSYLTTWGQSVAELKITSEDPRVDDLGDGVTAARLIEDLHTVPGLVQHAGYGPITRRIPEYFDMTVGSIHAPRDDANFYAFPYDWRRDNRVSARKLGRFVETQLPKWRAWSGASDAQVILIGHSMGGLVARFYVEALGGWKHCRALITIGSPHRGALGAVDTLSNGFKKLVWDFSGLVRSFSSIHQLLPVYPAVRVDGAWVRPAETDAIPNVERERAVAARVEFHDAIRLARESHLNEPGYRQLLIPWVGTRQDTSQSAEVVNGVLRLSYDPPAGLAAALADGDGTVPRVSTTPAGLENQQIERFVVERHGWMTNAESALEPLLDTLQQVGAPAVPGDFHGALESTTRAALGLRLESVFYPEETPEVGLRVHAASEPVELRLTVQSTEPGAAPVVREVRVAPDEPHVETFADLAPGLYRLTVGPVTRSAAAPEPVHGAFEVVA
ncbi:MAG TPA: hypothetical protein PLC98_12225 [Anaerolineales bacterium]|nr:hypothetical protein [Anaerolineales bacterium]